VSSTRLRDALRHGDMRRARRLLGRPYAIRGRVGVGERRGRTLGFPTANLHLRPRLLVPPDGVYAVVVRVDGAPHPGVLNIGVRPTFGGRRRTIEAHVLDFDGDLYRRWLVVDVVERLRGEASFAGPDALRDAIAADVVRARGVLADEDALRPRSRERT
jgi:riboflavin kinase/FMN adenylyltransferase